MARKNPKRYIKTLTFREACRIAGVNTRQRIVLVRYFKGRLGVSSKQTEKSV